MISGHATEVGTVEFARNHTNVSANHFKKFNGLTLSSIGIGTYLGNADDATDLMVKDAIVRSVTFGVNVIDTAINYRSQKAERSVGKAISQLVKEGKVKRDQLFISTKNGYVTNDADINEEFWQNIQNTLVKQGTIKPSDISSGYHCMSIPYLRDQLERSLKNLDLECVDLMYLHNPAEGQLQDISRDEFMEKLGKAFSFYESQRKIGKIRNYGMATWNCFRVTKEQQEYLSLFDVVELAKNTAGHDNGFKFIQMPYNMYYDQALTLKNQPENGKLISILEAAVKLGIGVFTSVPLMQAKLLGPNVIPSFGNLQLASHRAIQFVRSTPGVIAPLIGQKSPSHVVENLEIVKTPVLSEAEFSTLVGTLSS